jgi:PEGA domain
MRGLSIALTIAMITTHASAGGIGLLVVAPRDQRPAVEAAMADAMRGGPRVASDALGDARLAEASGAVAADQMFRFRRVREQIDEGWRAYHNVQNDFATSRLVAARQDAESGLALPGMIALYADASLRLGAVLASLGRTAEAHDAIALALALDPERPITQLEFSPEVVATVDAVRAQPRPTRSVHITSEPPSAVVNIDGRDAGRTPLTIELAIGQHVVIARAPQFSPHAQALAIASPALPGKAAPPHGGAESIDDKTGELAITLDHDDAAAELAAGVDVGTTDRATQVVTDRVLELADLDEVVLVASTDRRGGPTLLIQRCAGAPARCTAVVELGYADRSGIAAAARSAWQSARAADLRYPPSLFGDPRLTGNIAEHHCKLCRNPYVWAGVGVVAVAATIAIIVAVSSSHPPPILDVPPGSFTSH